MAMFKWIVLLVVEVAAFAGAFLGGMRVEAKRATGENSALSRFEMHVTPGAEIIRLDKMTGTLHVLAADGSIRDLPESATSKR